MDMQIAFSCRRSFDRYGHEHHHFSAVPLLITEFTRQLFIELNRKKVGDGQV